MWKFVLKFSDHHFSRVFNNQHFTVYTYFGRIAASATVIDNVHFR